MGKLAIYFFIQRESSQSILTQGLVWLHERHAPDIIWSSVRAAILHHGDFRDISRRNLRGKQKVMKKASQMQPCLVENKQLGGGGLSALPSVHPNTSHAIQCTEGIEFLKSHRSWKAGDTEPARRHGCTP